MNKVVVTIARQYGSGGLKVGKMLAEELGISCYDSEMFRLVSTNAGMHDQNIATDDRIKDTSLYDVAKEQYTGDLPSFTDDLVSLRDLYDYQSHIIEALAFRESCVIVGRCANYILKDRKDVLSVFIHAPLDFRIKRASTMHFMDHEALKNYVTQIDQKKADYYRDYTGEKWEDIKGYELSLDTSRYGIRGCVEKIRNYINQ